MYAVIRSGGKQYRVSEGDTVRLETLGGKVGGKHTFKGEEVLALGGDGSLKTDKAALAKAKVSATIVKQGQADKVGVFKFKKNSQYKILRGHRQRFTAVKIGEISAG